MVKNSSQSDRVKLGYPERSHVKRGEVEGFPLLSPLCSDIVILSSTEDLFLKNTDSPFQGNDMRRDNLRECPSCNFLSLKGMPGGRDAVCKNCGYKDPCCSD